MRNKKMNKKLDLNKETIANLEMEMNDIRGGATRTCETVEGPCLTEKPIYCIE
jgi:hypothetical protein